MYTNITTIKTQLTTIRETLSSIGPDMEIVHADMNGFKNDVDSLTAQLSVMGDPARYLGFIFPLFISIYNLGFSKSYADEFMDYAADISWESRCNIEMNV